VIVGDLPPQADERYNAAVTTATRSGWSMSSWLDTETKAILQGVPPTRQAPTDTIGFTLVLLSRTENSRRLREALARVRVLPLTKETQS
jgi:hypothetical protein